MEEEALRRQFMSYVERMKKVRLLSTPSLEDVGMAEDYSRMLLENFRKIGEYAGKNREMLDGVLFPLLRKKSPLTEEETKLLNELNRLLADGAQVTEIDIHLSEMITDFLSREEEKRLITKKKSINGMEEMIRLLENRLDILYARLYYCGRSDPKEWNKLLKESEICYEEACSYLQIDAFASLSEEVRVTAVMLAINGTSMYNTMPNASGNENLKYALEQRKLLKNVARILDDPFYQELIPPESLQKARVYIMSYIAAFCLLDGLSAELYEEACSCAVWLEKEWEADPATIEKEIYLNTIREFRLLSAFRTDGPDLEQCLEKAAKIYLDRDPSDYSLIGLDPNLSIARTLFLVLGGMKKKNQDCLSEQMEELLYSLPRDFLEYVFMAPKRENLGKYVNTLSGFLECFVELPNGMSIQDFCIHSMAAIHPPTYIHSNMVAKISECLCRHLLELKPEIFCGFPGCANTEDVVNNKDRILDYTRHAALYHDIGKLYVIDTISMYGRRIMQSEFDLIRSHPDKGADLAGRFGSTKEYADVIRGHHRWYDTSRGYPEDFDTSESPYKMIIDIVSVADCLDAATDGVGRSYRPGKTMDDFQKELEEGAGTRYAPYMKELFGEPAIRDDLAYLLENGREKLYKDTYYLLRDLLKKDGEIHDNNDSLGC